MNQDILSFYNTLFSTEIAIFGVITVLIFAFVQLMYGAYSHGELRFLIRNPFFWGYAIIGGLSLVLSALGSFYLSFITDPPQDGQVQGLQAVISSSWYALTCLFTLLTSIIFLILMLTKNIKYLRPNTILLLSKESIEYEHLSKFLFKKYGLQSPSDMGALGYIYGTQKDGIISKWAKAELGLGRLSDSEKVEYEKEKVKLLSDRQKYIEKISVLRKEAEAINDPLVPINTVSIRSIEKYDVSTMESAKEILLQLSQRFIKDNQKASSEWGPQWNPHSDLVGKYIDHLLENVETQLEICSRRYFGTGRLTLINMTLELAKLTLQYKRLDGLMKITEFWKRTADNYIGLPGNIFHHIMRYYFEISRALFEENEESMVENMCRDMGWIGERLLSKRGIEEKPLMYDYEYETEYENLMNCILSVGNYYAAKRPEWYPLTYFDAIDVIIRKLRDIQNFSDQEKLRSNIYSLIYTIYRFFEEALRIDSQRNVGLASLKMRLIFQFFDENNQDKSAKDSIDLLVFMAAYLSGRKDIKFVGTSVYEELFNTIAKANAYIQKISHSLSEADLKLGHGGYHENIWAFIIDLGKQMNSNFGFMFDHVTGKPYKEDDPRRK